MNNKLILPVVYMLVFVISSLIFSRNGGWRMQDLGQVFGLGGVVAGYFVSKVKKK